MDSLRLVQHTLRHTLYSLILILFVACSKLPVILTMGKGGQQGQQRLYTGKLRGRKRQRYHGNELHSAVIECNVKTVRAMLKKLTDQLKALMNEKDNLGYTPVFWCFDTTKTVKLKAKQAKSYLKILTYFLNHPYCDLATVDNCSKHLLHWAVITKNLEAVRLILDKLASSPEEQSKRLINQRNCFGYTPLHYLIFDKLNIFNEKKALAILQQFADHGANINAKDLDERTLLDWVADYSNNPKFMQMKPLERLKEQLESYKEKEPLSPFLSTHAKLDPSQATPAKTPDQPYLGLDLDGGAQERGLLKEATFDDLNEQMNRLQEPILKEYEEEVKIITKLFDFSLHHNILSDAYQANKIINRATAFSHFNEGKQEKDLFVHPQQDDASKPLKTCEARH